MHTLSKAHRTPTNRDVKVVPPWRQFWKLKDNVVRPSSARLPAVSRNPSYRNLCGSNRYGATVIEFAVCLPVFFLIAIGTVETCRMVYLRQSLKIAAYECARVAIVPGTLDSDVQNQCDAILLGRRIKDYQLSTTPESVASLKYGELYTVSISLPAEPNALVGAWFYKDKILQETVTIMAEF